MRQPNYVLHAGEATKLAIKRALADEPTIDELIASRHTIKHDYDDWS